MPVETITLYDLEVPLARTFTTASGAIRSRRVVLVAAEADERRGWGEAAPYPGVTQESVDDVWSGFVDGGTLPSTAAAALENADADLVARLAGRPLWREIGGTRPEIPASLAIGFAEDAVAAVAAAVGAGFGAVKLKIEPGRDVDIVSGVMEAFPDLTVGVDANGSYDPDERDALLELDKLGVAYVEQPFVATDLAAHVRLRSELVAPIAVDEAIGSTEDAIGVLSAGAADLLVLKPGRIGLNACRVIHDLALAAGVRIKASGLVETGIGRAHTMAVASLPGGIYSDIAPADAYLVEDPVVPRRSVVGGSLGLPAEAGIGCEPDGEALEHVLKRRYGPFLWGSRS